MSLLISLALQHGDFNLEVDAALPSSGISAICGHSGSGKTTLLRCIAGLDKAPQGLIQFKGQDWQSGSRCLPAEKRGVGMVFQDARLFSHLNVRGNLNYARRRAFQKSGPSHDEVCHWLDIRQLLNRPIDKLSGGEKKRVAIARALLRHPQILLMDEPLAGLHDSARDEMLSLLEGLPQHLDIPIIYVSHSFQEVSRLAEQVLLLDNGDVLAQDDIIALCSRLDLPLAQQQDAGAILQATLDKHDQHFNLSRVKLDQQHYLDLAEIRGDIGSPLRVFVPARDVSISLEAPSNSSILNRLSCTIDTIKAAGAAQVLLRLRIDDGEKTQFLLAKITRKSCEQLALKENMNVFAQIKSVALVNQMGWGQ
ncbi:molybdenum ABC transporter, ATP-binding protein [Spongiibacter sp. IMCC21906]|uniref:molybdenum ABC transporter ATP-binding protein n=1 Tax=Spongiibacter sp. IMCC21906 TaxID=1620392 RepID=UPI00062DCEDD|nr:molybdenum ABC transporter ATP-binding protein [Spongiibacter sp. IMCC21906]AKH70470.1 molybdenum ABC transporter, ATP-binding protein [Spongiibacter sp. IMCC21906]